MKDDPCEAPSTNLGTQQVHDQDCHDGSYWSEGPWLCPWPVGAGKNPEAAKPRLRTFMAGPQVPGKSKRNAPATLTWSSVPAKSHKAVSKGPSCGRAGGQEVSQGEV